MKNNDDLFDKDIRNRLKMENMKVPEEINKKIDDTINNLGKRKRNYKKSFRYMCSLYSRNYYFWSNNAHICTKHPYFRENI